MKCFVQSCNDDSVPWSAFCEEHLIDSDFSPQERDDQKVKVKKVKKAKKS